MDTRKTAIKKIIEMYDDGKTIFVTTDGYISREFWAMKSENVFPVTGSMGLAPAIAIGLALNCKNRIVCVNGDGSFLMSLGTQALIDHLKSKKLLKNFVHIVLNNECYESTGKQKCVRIPQMDSHFTNWLIEVNDEMPPRVEELKWNLKVLNK